MSMESLSSGVYHKVRREMLRSTEDADLAKSAARAACAMAKVVGYDFAMYNLSYVLYF